MPRTLTAAAFQPQADYLVSGYWRQVAGRAPFALEPGRDGTITVNLTGLDLPGRALARGALESWAMVSGLTFAETARAAQITFRDDGSRAHTGFDFGGPTGLRGATVTIGAGWLDRYGARIGDFGYHSYIHEIGHALGLAHAGAYDGSIPTWPKGVEFATDSWQTTVMSYYGQDDNPGTGASRAAVLGPQIADILAIQAIYGANAGGATAGNSVWGRGSNLDTALGRYFRDYYTEGVVQPAAVTFTILDTGGTDRLDLSHHGQDQAINLAPGGVSDAFNLTGNIIIMPGTVIERADAGRGDDQVWGNLAGNRITGHLGDDQIWGAAGNDSLMGDEGQDRLWGDAGDDRIDGGSQNDRIDGGIGRDTLTGDSGDDRIDGSDGDDRMAGGLGDDTLAGDAGQDRLWGDTGNDILAGGAGDDWMDGGRGDDRLTGQAGADVFVFVGGTDVITDMTRAERLLVDATLDRDGVLTAAELRAAMDVTARGIVIDLGGRGQLTLLGWTDADLLAGRADLV